MALNHAFAHLEAGLIEVLSGHDEAARKSWQSVLAMAPDSQAATSGEFDQVRIDNTAPTVSLADPGADLRGTVTLAATAGEPDAAGLARVEGRAVGVLANDCRHLSGAIDSDGADKAARFMQLCDAFDLPIVTLIDTPGAYPGIDAEERNQSEAIPSCHFRLVPRNS